MKIVKYSKLKKNKYRVLLDDDSKYDFYDDIILKYGVSINAVAESVRRSVKYNVEQFTGMIVDAVNINVVGVKV